MTETNQKEVGITINQTETAKRTGFSDIDFRLSIFI